MQKCLHVLLIVIAAQLTCSSSFADDGTPDNQGPISGIFSPELMQVNAVLTTPEFPIPFQMNGYVLPGGSVLMGAVINPSTGQAWFVSGTWGHNWFGGAIVTPDLEIVGYVQGTFDDSRQILNAHWFIYNCAVSPVPLAP